MNARNTRYDKIQNQAFIRKTIHAPEKIRRFFIQAFYPPGVQNL